MPRLDEEAKDVKPVIANMAKFPAHQRLVAYTSFPAACTPINNMQPTLVRLKKQVNPITVLASPLFYNGSC